MAQIKIKAILERGGAASHFPSDSLPSAPHFLRFCQDRIIEKPNIHIPLKRRYCIYPIDQQAHTRENKTKQKNL